VERARGHPTINAKLNEQILTGKQSPDFNENPKRLKDGQGLS
jgi:hypothetical protein